MYIRIKGENRGMRFLINRASLWKGNPRVAGAFKQNDEWLIEINNLDQLILFLEKEGQLIFSSTSYTGRDIQSIQVFDNYNEAWKPQL